MAGEVEAAVCLGPAGEERVLVLVLDVVAHLVGNERIRREHLHVCP